MLPRWSDDALRGAFWRRMVGHPSSKGCIGSPALEAKMLYDWAEVGTPTCIDHA
jgi:lipoprotein-anchoring transpeptidase ErfK/SrfK